MWLHADAVGFCASTAIADCGSGYDVVYYDRNIDTVQSDCEERHP